MKTIFKSVDPNDSDRIDIPDNILGVYYRCVCCNGLFLYGDKEESVCHICVEAINEVIKEYEEDEN
jgi:hypothetical protein